MAINYYNFYLLKYNNWLNKEEKKFNSITEYEDYLVTDIISPVKNWTPGDGVDTTQVINYPQNTDWLGEPDYCVVTDDKDNILSRWFVMECDQTRTAQLKLKLHRDAVIDNYDAVLDSPCFIEKAKLPGSNDLIFNSENMTYNQIKKKEILLKDESETPWIVGYLAKDLVSKTGSITVGANYDISLSDIDHDDWTYYSYRSAASAIRDIPTNVTIGFNVGYVDSNLRVNYTKLSFDNYGNKTKSSWLIGWSRNICSYN